MPEYLLQATLIPTLIAIIWALVVKIRMKDWTNTIFLTLAACTLLANGFAVSHLIRNIEIPIWLLLSQMLLSVTVVPQAYYYFCRQLGTSGSLTLKVTLWLLLLIMLVPSINVDIHPAKEAIMQDPIAFMHFNIFSAGKRIYSITLPSVIILLQAIFTIARVPTVTKLMRTYQLKVNSGSKFFVLWWLLAIVFCVGSSLIEIDMLRTPTATWVYYITYTLLIVGIYSLIAKGLDLNPIQSDDDEQIESLDAFIEQNRELAQQARRLFLQEKLYLRPGITIEDVAKMLGTNRTYFTRMMRAEFDMSFNEYITQERITYSQQLLNNTDKTLEEIAMESGFSNASSFCRVFKRITDVTPDSWRKSHS